MLVSFEIENYMSFADRARVDLSVGAAAPENFHFLNEGASRVAKIAGILGPNAAGKTNLLRALPAIADFIANSFGYRLERPLPFRPHFFEEDIPVKMQLEFVLPENGRRYRYALEAMGSRVLSESLRVKTSKFFSRVFERAWSADGYQVVGLGERHLPNLRENVSWLSWLAQYNVSEALAIVQYFVRLKSNLEPRGPRIPSFISSFEAVEFYRSRPELTSKMVAQLNRWDIDIYDIEFKRVEVDGEDESGPWMAYSVHKQGDRTARLPIHSESSGTVGLFCLLSIVLPVLNEGGIAVIDELESDLHPHMLEALLELFVQPETNPKNAQLLFTSHADWLMNRLHKTQIFLVEKSDGGSEVFRLSDIKGVQARENFSARYRSGAYGAVPDIE